MERISGTWSLPVKSTLKLLQCSTRKYQCSSKSKLDNVFNQHQPTTQEAVSPVRVSWANIFWYACFYQGLQWTSDIFANRKRKARTNKMHDPDGKTSCSQWSVATSPSKSANHWYKPSQRGSKTCFKRKTMEQLWETAWYWSVWADAKLLQLLLFFQICLGGLSQSQAKTTDFVRAQALSKQASICL